MEESKHILYNPLYEHWENIAMEIHTFVCTKIPNQYLVQLILPEKKVHALNSLLSYTCLHDCHPSPGSQPNIPPHLVRGKVQRWDKDHSSNRTLLSEFWASLQQSYQVILFFQFFHLSYWDSEYLSCSVVRYIHDRARIPHLHKSVLTTRSWTQHWGLYSQDHIIIINFEFW